MRFLADMGVSMRVVEWLRAEGHDAVHLHEGCLQLLPDSCMQAFLPQVICRLPSRGEG